MFDNSEEKKFQCKLIINLRMIKLRIEKISLKDFMHAVFRYIRPIFIMVSVLSLIVMIAGRGDKSIIRLVCYFNVIIYLGLVLSMILHESFHYIAMKKCGIRVIGIDSNIYRFSVFTQENIQGNKLLFIALAGVFSTTCIGCILSVVNIFADSSLIRVIMWIYYIHLINILPLFGDGKMIIKALITMRDV